MAKSFLDQHPPRVDWDKLRRGPTEADLADLPPATEEEWERDGYRAEPLPDDIARELEQRATKRRKGSAAE